MTAQRVRHLGHWNGVIHDGDQPSALWDPPGSAHRFLVLTDFADVLYRVTDSYGPGTGRLSRLESP